MNETPSAPPDPMPHLPGSEAITQSSKSNLALSFAALPEAERRAMSIFYAFCRVVDDVADSTELPIAEKRRQLGEWRKEIRRAYEEKPLTPLGREMAEIIRTYRIPPEPLEEILNGVEMDLSIERYPAFLLLEQYCYRVASAVGLVSIEIFGCRHARSRDYAVALGMAFQLTNILRDVEEDAARNRVYLPLENLAAHNIALESLLHRNPGAPPTPNEKALLAEIANRAEVYYRSAEALLPLIHRESRPALWVLVSIYHALLRRIERADYDVFSKRASVPLHQKLNILALGMVRVAAARLFG